MDKKLLFNEALTSLVDFAAANANHVTMDDVKLYFKDLIDDDSQYQFIYDYLALNKVEIEGFTPPANNPLADDAPETSADETISETASVYNHVESEEELSFIKMYMEEMEALPNLSKDEEADLIDKLLAGDTSVSSKIVEANLSLVAKIAESHRGKGVNFGDLIQEGNVGLMLAVSDYTESVGDFHSFISGRIEDAIKNTVNVQINSDRIGQHLADKLNRLDEVTKNLSEKLGRVPELDELAKAMNISKDEASILLKTSLDTLSVLRLMVLLMEYQLKKHLQDLKKIRWSGELIRNKGCNSNNKSKNTKFRFCHKLNATCILAFLYISLVFNHLLFCPFPHFIPRIFCS